MTEESMRPTPRSAIVAWWQAMQEKDVDAIERMTLDDYISSEGPGGRTLGKHEFMEEARLFLGAAEIEDWSVSGLEVRTHGDVAVCSYVWDEQGSQGSEEFDFGGVATDVLVFEGGRWRHQAHHVSTFG
ncbi:nuclear transport factor 2 family protein [Rubrobacter radiotolerans]|nr:nuclear transport factor 2 family protein [Rubrobacter radiotolerans]MDX5895390.1 nuclear transport factor 2 family protein [Rubrobacter radiotolerans]SMC01751.1 Ketosteroid isomerase homolog [Rubrobacter radiotolerans DSM 5868]